MYIDQKLEHIQREYCIFGMRRSGQHAIARWVLRQLPGHSLFLNDLPPRADHPTLRNPDKRRLDRVYIEGEELPPQGETRIDNLVYNHEDFPFTAPSPQRLKPGRGLFRVILVLRESYNIFASRYYFWTRMHPGAPRWRWDDTELWLNHARHFQKFSRQRPPNITPILLERWQSDMAYREEIARQLRLNFSDAGHNDVDHIGSTFDLHRFNGKAAQMPIHSRWRQVIDIPAYRKVLTRPGVIERNKVLFPDHPAYRQLEEPLPRMHSPSLQNIVALAQAGDIENARKAAVSLCHAEPHNTQAWNYLAAISAQAGSLDDVVACCQRIIELEPGNLQARYNLGTALTTLQRHSEAISVYQDLIAQQPGNSATLTNLAAALRGNGQLEQAIERAQQALALDSNLHPARTILGLALLESGHADQAVQQLRQLVSSAPSTAGAHYNLGLALLAANDATGAVAALRTAVQQNPAHADACTELSRALHKAGDAAAALATARQAATQFPEHAGAQDSLGVRLTEHGELDAAHPHFEAAHALAPRNPDILCHLGNSYMFRNEVHSALNCYEDALRNKPDHAQAHWQRAWSLLLLGRLVEGWEEYEWRFQAGIAQRPDYPQPQWQGEPLQGRRILLYGEQGFGDSIQFIRYAQLVKQRGGQVIVHCRKELKALYSTCPGVDQLIDEQDPLPAFDLQAPLLSLPRIFATTLENIPAPPAYLHAPVDRAPPAALAEAEDDARLKVGIAWCGNPAFRWNRFRSASLETLAPLLARTDIRLFSLQKGDASGELHNHAERIGNLGDGFRDFADTAAAMQALDLIITTDTSVVHLAGALGRETWLLLSYAADWRWLLDRSDSPWYPSLRLFRQPTPGDWDTPVRAIMRALDERLRVQTHRCD